MPQIALDAPQEFGYGRVWISDSKSRKGVRHTTLLDDKGKWNCTCEAWRYRYNCKHVNTLKEQLGDDDDVQVNL